MFKFYIKCIALLFFCFMQINCIETFVPKTLTFEDILVVEAIITDELVQQQITLSRTTPIEDNGLSPEVGAQVIVLDDLLNSYEFLEIDPGIYVSTVAFSAEMGRNYELSIVTTDNEIYTSDKVSMAGTSMLEEVTATRKTNINGTDGVEISVTGSGLNGDAFFFRYEYEETYQIQPPFIFNLDLVVISDNPPSFGLEQKTTEENLCYKTDNSNIIVLANTNDLFDNKVENIPVHFIASNNPIVRDRYSILVKQFAHTMEAYSFYETLSEISDLENLFSQLQPGFVEGNIHLAENLDENVLGIFEVTSVSSKRIFFNFNDIFPDTNRPPYFVSCTFEDDFISFSPSPTQQEFFQINNLLNSGYKLISIEEGFFEGIVDYIIAPPACVDCKVLGTVVEPDFWEE